MRTLNRPRPLIAWLLYVSVLFNLLACSVAHGQNSGLQLSGLGVVVCSNSAEGASSTEWTGSVPGEWIMSCALCAGLLVAIAAAFFFVGLQRQPHQVSFPPPVWRMPPRYLWPSANPRASPGV